MEERLRLAFGILANAASLMLYSSPVLTFIKMIKKRSTGDFSCIPYIVTMMTCLLWMWYGLPVVSRGLENLSLITIGCIGFTLELSFVSIFFSLASSRARIQIILTVVPLLLLACGIGAITTFAFHDHRLRKAFVGSIGDAVCVAMYASPLVAIRQVVRTKSVEFMPLHLSVFTFLTSFTWMLYGLLSKDLFIAAPNFIGCPLGILQLILYFVYYKREIQEDTRRCDEDSTTKQGGSTEKPNDNDCNGHGNKLEIIP